MQRAHLLRVALGMMVAIAACGSEDAPKTVTTTDRMPCKNGDPIKCEDGEAVRCVDEETETTDCSENNELCVPDLGCRLCVPGTGKCDGETTQLCSEDGKRWIDGEVCSGADGVHCHSGFGTCVNLCEMASDTRSYVGCDYYPVSTANIVGKSFEYAVIVSNPQAVPAHVKITAEKSESSAAFEESAKIMPGELREFVLPWRRTGDGETTALTDTAYHLTSDVPVSAYQFNPLQYRLDGDCPMDDYDPTPGDDACYSYTNDASLLLPTTALGSSYMLVAPATAYSTASLTDGAGNLLYEDDAGTPAFSEFLQNSAATLVATADTTVKITPTVAMISEQGLAAPGDEVELKLKRGHASQLFFLSPESLEDCPGMTDMQELEFPCDESTDGVCALRRNYCHGADPTGTRVRSEQPLAVYVGSPCSFVPYNRRACDHLEETLPPLRTWGKEIVVAVTDPIADEPNIVRIVSAVDGNELVFDPSDVHDAVTLDAGEVVEIIAHESFMVKGTQPLLAAQYLVGLEDVGLEDQADPRVMLRTSGDPSLTFAAPIEQFRRDFDFLTPDTYDSGYITVVAPSGTDVQVDGQYVARWQDIGDSGYVVGHHKINPGTHRVRGTLPIAVQVYGFGAYTSYMFPAGLNLEQVNEVE